MVSADFGMFRRPDRQDPALTFNFIPKSAVLGICGAILGLEGYKHGKKRPEFLSSLQHFKVAITPLLQKNTRSHPSPLRKTFVKFINFHGYGNVDGPWILTEQVLINPSYRLVVISDSEDEYFTKLEKHLRNRTSVFRPYLGKNEFICNMDFLGTYEVEEYTETICECESIYPPSGFVNTRGSSGIPYTFTMLEEYSYGLDQYHRHKIKRFCFRDGSIHRKEADLELGAFLSLSGNSTKTVFAF